MLTDDEMDDVFQALAHAHRRRILDLVLDRPGIAVGEVAKRFDTSRIAVMNHLAILERAGLIISRKDGRCRRLHLNAVPIQLIHDRWTTHYSAYWSGHLTGLKYTAEAATKEDRDKWV